MNENKPTFLTKKQREELALQRLQNKRSLEEAKLKDEETAHQRFITGKTIEDRNRELKEKERKEELEKERRRVEESKDTVEHDHEVKAIREHYLGGQEKKRKIIKPSEKFTRIFQFDWEATDDTTLNDKNPLYNNRMKINALFGRGYIAGVDQKEQRKESNFLMALSEKRAKEMSVSQEKDQTEDDRRLREKRASEILRKQLEDLNKTDDKIHDKMGRHWSEKSLEEMNERDWRIFREDFDIRIQGGRATLPIRFWKEASLPSELMKAIESVGYDKPSPIQRQAIPIGLAKRDIIGIAETGSGKTAAFLIPLLCYMLQLPQEYIDRTQHEGPLAVVMAPTRELAQQIEEESLKLSKFTKFRTISVVGGQSIEEQGFKLRKGVEIVIGTPGRMVDCIENNYLVLNQCNYVVLDEADRMIDMGFEPQVVAVLDVMGGLLKSEDEEQAELQVQTAQSGKELFRVTAMFSATMPPQVEQIARTYLRHPVLIRIGDEDTGKNKRIEQKVLFISDGQKRNTLTEELKKLSSNDKIIVFVNEKKHGDSLGYHLESLGYHIGILHGGRSQDQREETLDMFRSGKIQVLVATDVAGRGLDIPDVSNVFNYDCPSKIQNYCHRIGRTGRAGKFGIATTFLTENDTEIIIHRPHQLAKHPSAQAPFGTRDDKGNLVGKKKDSIQFSKK
eukprot:gene5883-8113_t